ncbi:hypothetical protein E2562_005988 [Oryza meyeriana var. granulata]|uniref:Uncharacterized protein n=1 Tax=Oryza meyeriana var. granulata TaxID=110450 RepID=A0A6G1EVF6_9ORYZ|nr:hypothetical protein E2562_005988 [Oryza meyeriana var. granulata]
MTENQHSPIQFQVDQIDIQKIQSSRCLQSTDNTAICAPRGVAAQAQLMIPKHGRLSPSWRTSFSLASNLIIHLSIHRSIRSRHAFSRRPVGVTPHRLTAGGGGESRADTCTCAHAGSSNEAIKQSEARRRQFYVGERRRRGEVVWLCGGLPPPPSYG